MAGLILCSEVALNSVKVNSIYQPPTSPVAFTAFYSCAAGTDTPRLQRQPRESGQGPRSLRCAASALPPSPTAGSLKPSGKTAPFPWKRREGGERTTPMRSERGSGPRNSKWLLNVAISTLCLVPMCHFRSLQVFSLFPQPPGQGNWASLYPLWTCTTPH